MPKRTAKAPTKNAREKALEAQVRASGATLYWEDDHWLIRKDRSLFRVYDDTAQHDIDRFLSGAAS